MKRTDLADELVLRHALVVAERRSMNRQNDRRMSRLLQDPFGIKTLTVNEIRRRSEASGVSRDCSSEVGPPPIPGFPL